MIAGLREPLGCEACPLVLEDLTASNRMITVEPEDWSCGFFQNVDNYLHDYKVSSKQGAAMIWRWHSG